MHTESSPYSSIIILADTNDFLPKLDWSITYTIHHRGGNTFGRKGDNTVRKKAILSAVFQLARYMWKA